MKQFKLVDYGVKYQTISVIGCQSSGKSMAKNSIIGTLLNKLFHTNFEVMNAEMGRNQTTKGIVFSWDPTRQFLILDVEGIDSRERGDSGHIFEQATSLLALAMSDVFMINMWTQDVGRYTASNIGLLKVVFEMNLKIVEKQR